MKTLNLIGILTLMLGLLSLETSAQQIGVKVGATFANQSQNFDGDNIAEDAKLKIGTHAGLTALFPISDRFFFEPGLLLNNKGTKTETEILGQTIESTLSLNYLDVPLTVKYLFPLSNFDIYIQGGPTVGFGLAGKVKVDDNDTDVEWGTDTGDMIKRPDLAFSAGAGVILMENLHLGFLTNTGLLNVAADDQDGKYKAKNHFFQLGLSYFFGER